MATPACKKYVLGEFVLEADSLRLSVADAPVHLTHKPFQVLLYLIEHRDRMVTRHELLEHFWQGHDVYDETLTKCVGAIRKALDDQTEQPRFIVTHWAEGYRYIGPLEVQGLEGESSTFGIEKTRGVRIVVEEQDNGVYPEQAGEEKVIPVESRAEPLRLPAPRRPSRTVLAVFLLGLLALTATFLMVYRHRTHTGLLQNQPAPIRSIAVLPLKNLSGDQAQEYFGDGMTDSLITALSNIDGLKVISRGSVFQFKGKEIDPRDVGKQLGVAAVLEGSVRKDGDSVRVTVRLVSAEDGHVLWASETYERALRDLFSLQDEVARNVANGLKFQLSGPGIQKLTKRYTNNVDAYQLYVKGRYFWNKRTEEGLKKAIENFEQAIALDSSYALAYSGVADCSISLSNYGVLPAKEAYPKAKASALIALERDEQLAEAHTSLAHITWLYEWDWASAEREFRRALELNPNYATGHQWYSVFLSAMARHQEAIAEARQAQTLDPVSAIITMDVARALFFARQYDEAITQCLKAVELDPGYAGMEIWLVGAYEKKGLYDQAVEAHLRGRTAVGVDPAWIAALRAAYMKSGWHGYWQKELARTHEIAREHYVTPYNLAYIYAHLGDRDQAFTWLWKAYEEHSDQIVVLRVDPVLDNLRQDPRFQDLLRRVGLATK